MKAIKIVALFLLLFGLSCSSSSNDDKMVKNTEDSVIGYWVLTDLTIKESTPENEIEFLQKLKEALPYLTCEFITMDISVDKSLFMKILSKFSEEEINSNNPVIECLDFDSVPGTWSLDENVLTITNSDDFSAPLTIRFEFGRLIIESGAGAFGQLGLETTELIFEKLAAVE